MKEILSKHPSTDRSMNLFYSQPLPHTHQAYQKSHQQTTSHQFHRMNQIHGKKKLLFFRFGYKVFWWCRFTFNFHTHNLHLHPILVYFFSSFSLQRRTKNLFFLVSVLKGFWKKDQSFVSKSISIFFKKFTSYSIQDLISFQVVVNRGNNKVLIPFTFNMAS